jgi:hypothetical protein
MRRELNLGLLTNFVAQVVPMREHQFKPCGILFVTERWRLDELLFFFFLCVCVWRNQQLVGHVLALHVVVLSNCYHYNLQVCPQCPLRGTQGKSGGVELETSWNFIFMALAN